MRRPEFEAYLAEAKLYPELWRLALGILLIFLQTLAFSILVIAIYVGVVVAQAGPNALFEILPAINAITRPDTPVVVVTLLATFLGFFLAPILAAGALHFRGPGTLFGDGAEWLRGFLVSLTVVLVIFGAFTALGATMEKPVQNLDFDTWLFWLPFALPLLFVQIGAEELVFRGYLQQQLAARFQSRVIWMWIPSVVFALLHFSPEAGGNLPLILLSTLTFALAAADLTERTGALGAAMGMHFGNNFLGIFIVSIGETITGLSLYVTPTDIGETGLQSI
ncbi:MAG: type II CAAX endopeptidase family protein, partial [Pseudomonadota bacterium]